MPVSDLPHLTCTEAEFIAAFRRDGFLSPFIEEASPAFVHQHRLWFDHAVALNSAGLDAFCRRDDEVVGLSSHHPKAIAMRMILRALTAFQGAVILYRRGMITEGDTLARNVYETAFWLGFFHHDSEAAVGAFINDERKSQKSTLLYKKHELGEADIEIINEIDQRIAELNSKIEKGVSIQEVAKISNLYKYYGTYRELSASSAHNSLNSLHTYLNRNPHGSYDGHIFGPDPDRLTNALPILCVGLCLSVAFFCTIVAIDDDEPDLQSLLIKTDALRGHAEASGDR